MEALGGLLAVHWAALWKALFSEMRNRSAVSDIDPVKYRSAPLLKVDNLRGVVGGAARAARERDRVEGLLR